jgi:hypothetical protein
MYPNGAARESLCRHDGLIQMKQDSGRAACNYQAFEWRRPP